MAQQAKQVLFLLKTTAKLRKDFEAFGFRTETNKTNAGKIKLSVPSGGNGTTGKLLKLMRTTKPKKTLLKLKQGEPLLIINF